jgi:[protein-PII] uridylyltransferase
LLLGALLHDIGKGFPGDHTEAGIAVVPDIARRLGFPPADVAMLTTLVRHHLLLPDTATRRDLDDPATVESVVSAVVDRHTLELLHALTEADAAATGPGAWNDWKAGLVAQLVARSAAAIAGEPEPEAEPLDPRRLALAEAGELAVDLEGSRLTIVAPDSSGLLWRWAAVLTLHRLEVRSASAVSVSSGRRPMAVTLFDVAPRFGSLPDVEALRLDVRHALEDPRPLAEKLAQRERVYAAERPTSGAPPRVLWIDDASRTSTVVEIRAHDVLGLLYRLSKVLADVGVELRSARIHTIGADVVDTFYVAEADGSAVTEPTRREQIERMLLAACQVAD